jgi:hypothetical protein
MLAAFPRHDGWVTLRLAEAPDDGQPLRLLELIGSCPGDPDAQPVRLTRCATAQDAHEHAAKRVAAGWAAYANEPPAGSRAARASRHNRAATAPHARSERPVTGRLARAAVVHAAAADPEQCCLFPNPSARR